MLGERGLGRSTDRAGGRERDEAVSEMSWREGGNPDTGTAQWGQDKPDSKARVPGFQPRHHHLLRSPELGRWAQIPPHVIRSKTSSIGRDPFIVCSAGKEKEPANQTLAAGL